MIEIATASAGTSANRATAVDVEGPPSPTRRSDLAACAWIGLGLFALAAWPLICVDAPPLQDLPNHLASEHIAERLALYPQFVFNGLFKSNALLTLWLRAAHGLGWGLLGAGRAFTALVLLASALALPYFVLAFAGRRRMLVASLLVWPLVHGFFVSMGMLNFAFAFPLSLFLLTVLDGQRRQPSLARAGAIAGLSALLWYSHPFPLAVVFGLVILQSAHCPGGRARFMTAAQLLGPLAPVGLPLAVTAFRHLVKAEGAPPAASSEVMFHAPLALLAHFWLDASGAFTRWGSMTIVPAILLPWVAWNGRHPERPLPFFSARALVALGSLYLALPFMLSNWAYLNCRLVPFLWAGLALRVPPRIPRAMTAVLLGCAVTFSGVLGHDYLRLEHDRQAFTAGIAAVPRRANLLPLIFERHGAADFTAPLTHGWAYYVLEKDTSAPLVFAVERSYAITYRQFPPAALISPALDRFAESHAGPPARTCAAEGRSPGECEAEWRARWEAFWRQAEPRFSHVLTWAMPQMTRETIPSTFRRTFVAGSLEIFEHTRPPPPIGANTPRPVDSWLPHSSAVMAQPSEPSPF